MTRCGAMPGRLEMNWLRASPLRCAFTWLGLLAFAVCLLLAVEALGAEGAASTPSAAAPYLILDGKTFRAEAFEDGAKVFEDQLVFKDGAFSSEACRKFGFTPSPYYVRIEGNQIQFLAETVSPTHGTMVWKGTVSGNELEGGLHWTKERWYWTVRRNFDVKGTHEK